MSKLTLSFAGIEVGLSRFINEDCPRTVIEIGDLSYTAAGTPVGSGAAYENKHLWDISILCEPAQLQKIQAIYAAHQNARRALQPADILISDKSQHFAEVGARKRSIVPGTQEISLAGNTLYYAQFKAWFSKAPKVSERGIVWLVNFQLMETDKA